MCIIFDSYDHLMFVYPVYQYIFYDQWPFYLVAMAKLESREFVKHQQGKKTITPEGKEDPVEVVSFLAL